jgi:hypothetical protein
MTIALELHPDLAARFVTEAKAKGVPVDEVVRAYLYHARRNGVPRSSPLRKLIGDSKKPPTLSQTILLMPVGRPLLEPGCAEANQNLIAPRPDPMIGGPSA